MAKKKQLLPTLRMLDDPAEASEDAAIEQMARDAIAQRAIKKKTVKKAAKKNMPQLVPYGWHDQPPRKWHHTSAFMALPIAKKQALKKVIEEWKKDWKKSLVSGTAALHIASRKLQKDLEAALEME